MANRAVIDQKALGQFMRSPQPQAALDVAVGALATKIEDETPVNKGDAQDSIRWRRYPLSRRAYSTDPFYHLIEWGSVNNMIYAPFRRAARALGFRLVETPKAQRDDG